MKIKEESSEYYDAIYKSGGKNDIYFRSGKKAVHIHIWNEIIKKLSSEDNILELGCGTGQLAEVLLEKFNYLLGIDFSLEGIRISKQRFYDQCTKDKFILGDVLNKHLYNNLDYNTVMCTEVLEHITDDLKLICNLKKGCSFFATVPNFGGVSHVRHFKTEKQILNRYSRLLDIETIIPFIGKHTIFLIISKVK